MPARKTFSVDDFKSKVNARIANVSTYTTTCKTDAELRAYRLALANVLETVLHDSGNYHGFCYIDGKYDAGVTDVTRVRYY